MRLSEIYTNSFPQLFKKLTVNAEAFQLRLSTFWYVFIFGNYEAAAEE